MKKIFLVLITYFYSLNAVSNIKVDKFGLVAGGVSLAIGLISTRLTIKYTKEWISDWKQENALWKKIEDKNAKINWSWTTFGNVRENRYTLDLSNIIEADKDDIMRNWEAFQKVKNKRNWHDFIDPFAFAFC